jgi:hypothetical protein
MSSRQHTNQAAAMAPELRKARATSVVSTQCSNNRSTEEKRDESMVSLRRKLTAEGSLVVADYQKSLKPKTSFPNENLPLFHRC